jgi:asparagine synthase (glutamine-hydrolysing)
VSFEGQDAFDYARSLMVKADDTPYAAAAAGALGMEHRIAPVPRSTLADDLRTLASQNDALPAWEQELAQYHLARAVSRDFRAVLAGDAADETHYGYGFLLDDAVIEHPRALMDRFGTPPLNKSLGSDPAESLAARYHFLTKEAGLGGSSRADRLRAATHLIVQRWLPRLLHNGDIHFMAHGVEARVPFADSLLLDVAVRVHPELGIRNGTEKWLLRESARGVIPENIRTRRKSSLPKDDGANGVLRQEARRALDASGPLIGSWLDVPAVRALCDAPGQLAQPALLFRVIALHHWSDVHNVRAP